MRHVSIKQMLAQIIRNTRLSDTSYIDDLYAWIFEALEMMECTPNMESLIKNVEVTNNMACIPSGCVDIIRINHNGKPLRKGSMFPSYRNFQDYRDSNNWQTKSKSANTFILNEDSEIDGQYLPRGVYQDIYSLNQNKIIKVNDPDYLQKIVGSEGFNHCYHLELGKIKTSFESGTIQLYYNAFPTDEEGYPLINANVHFRNAVYYHCVLRLMEAGYQHPLYTDPRQVEEKYYREANLADKHINYVTPDEMESMKNSWVKLVQTGIDYDAFFNSSLTPQNLNTDWI